MMLLHALREDNSVKKSLYDEFDTSVSQEFRM